MTTDPDFDAAAASDEPDAPTRRWPVLLIGAVVLALGLAGGWFGLRALQGNQREDAIRAVATDFYAALAAGDATKAASLSATPLPTSPLLTAKARRRSRRRPCQTSARRTSRRRLSRRSATRSASAK